MDKFSISPKSYVCKTCDYSFITPQHCGRPMEITEINGNDIWMCWKGDHDPCCGREAVEDYEPCCDKPDLVAGIHIDESNVLL